MTDLSHITIDEAAGKADCSVCGIGVSAPPSFGGIPRPQMLASFLVQHSVHSRGKPTGLTPTGRASKAAREAIWGGAS